MQSVPERQDGVSLWHEMTKKYMEVTINRQFFVSLLAENTKTIIHYYYEKTINTPPFGGNLVYCRGG